MKSRFDNILKPVVNAKNNNIMTLSEAVEYSRISKPTLVKLIKNGDLPGGQFGGIWRIPREEFVEAFEKRLRGNYRG